MREPWGDKRWLGGLVVKLNYESYSSCCVGVWVAHPNDVWERAGIGASLGGSRDLQQGYATSKEDAGGAGTQVENIFFFSPPD